MYMIKLYVYVYKLVVGVRLILYVAWLIFIHLIDVLVTSNDKINRCNRLNGN